MGGEPRASARVRRIHGAVACAGVALCAGCASTQTFRLDCVPEEVAVYVDGRLLEERPEVLQLDADEPHKLYFKLAGHEPQLVVLDTLEDEQGEPRLEPGDVCVELVPVGLARELEIEVEEDVEAPSDRSGP